MKYAPLLLLAFALLGQQGDREVPLCRRGECIDDVTGGDREGQPQWCQNKTERGHKANCACKRSCDRSDRGSECKTYCRTARCRCDHGCPMTE